MKLNDALILRKIGSKHMIVNAAGANVNMTEVLTLNSSAAALWQEFSGREFNAGDMVSWLCDRYDVAPEQAEQDINNLLTQWKEFGMLS
jgi:hypothetical protein